MNEKLEVTPNQVPPLRLHKGWLELSTHASCQFAKYVPYPWLIWGIGLVSTWTVVVLTALLDISSFPANFPDACSRYTATCSNQCGNEYFGLLVVTSQFVALIGVLFQVLIILRHWSRIKVVNTLAMFVVWGVFFFMVYVGNAALADLDAGTWTYCLHPLSSAVTVIAVYAVLYIVPLPITLLIALTVTYRLWPLKHTKPDTSF